MTIEPTSPNSESTPQRVKIPAALLNSGLSRRGILRAMGLLGGTVALSVTADAAWATSGPSTAGNHTAAKAGLPQGFKGDLTDIKHVVVFMQENRSFDHYYGALPGVRGHNDKQALTFPNGTQVFEQPHGDETVKPIRVTTVAGTTTGLDHSYKGGLAAWNEGRHNNWIAAKGPETMHYLTGEEIPWQWTLANAYTICDNWHCSVMGPTTPNRLYHWTGTSQGTTDNGGEYFGNRTWETYPEALQKAGVSWRVYCDTSTDQDSWLGDYGDNPIRGFNTFTTGGTSPQDLLNRVDVEKNRPGTGLIWRANSSPYKPVGLPNDDSNENLDGVLREFITSCKPDAEYPLPDVSWIVAPYEWSEHPSANPEHGAHITNRIIQAIQENPERAKDTLLILTFDENDGYFDHVLQPFAEPGTPDEYTGSTPIGFGVRVPGILISPWTRGGYVSSETFDHTSIIQFLETWTAAHGKPAVSPNISAWRRAISGNLTSALDLKNPIFDRPELPNTEALVEIARQGGTISSQVAPADKWDGVSMKYRPLNYQPEGAFVEDRKTGKVSSQLTLSGGISGKAVNLQVFPDKYLEFASTPFTVSAKKPGTYEWDTTAHDGKYAFSVYGPDGFVRSHAGSIVPTNDTTSGIPRVDVALKSGPKAGVCFTLHNDGKSPVDYTLKPIDHAGDEQAVCVLPGSSVSVEWPTASGYYDVQITVKAAADWIHRYAGRVAELKK